MKKILFLLLLSVATYGQTYQNPTFGTVTTKTSPTVTTPAFIGTLEATGVNGKIPSTYIEKTENKATDFTTVNNTLYPTVQAVKTYADGLVVGLLNDRGSYDASSNLFPTTGGSGTSGAILKGDIWYVSVAGTLGGKAVAIGDSFRALANTPAQTAANWSLLSSNLAYVPANDANVIHTTGNETKTGTLTATSFIKSGTTSTNALLAGGGTLANPISGSGTTNYFPKFTGTNTLGNSVAFESGGFFQTSNDIFLDGVRLGKGSSGNVTNVVFGFDSATNNVSGISNISLGSYSLHDNLSSYNIAIGGAAMYGNLNGTRNTGVGFEVLNNVSSGDDNLAFGYRAGRKYTGDIDITTSNTSLFIGSLTKALGNSQSNQIVIGYDATGNGSNTATLGNSSITDTYLNGVVHGTTFAGGATLINAPTAPTATAGTNTTQIATTAFVQGVSRPYKVYTALISQSGTSAPTAKILENTLGGSVTFNYGSTGLYSVDAPTGSLTADKTYIFINKGNSTVNANQVKAYYFSTNAFRIQTYDSAFNQANGVIDNDALLEVRVYN